MSPRGRLLLSQREGVVLNAYRDSKGVWTIGVGHTTTAGEPRVTPGMRISPEQCDEILSRDLATFEAILNKALKVTVADHEFDALLSVMFNVGPKFATSTCINKLNTGRLKDAAEAILMWNKPEEIRGRRKTEYEQFKTPYKGAGNG